MSTTYTVTGMTCAHCVASVTEEVEQIDGVTAAEVDLSTGSLVVRGAASVSTDDVRRAVEEAGYDLE